MGAPRPPTTIVLVLFASLLAGCTTTSSQRPTTPAPAADGADPATAPRSEQLAAQTTVALRVTRDPDAKSGARVRVVAVVHDRDGAQHVTDLGDYPGTVSERSPVGEELIRIAIEDGDDICALHLTRRGDHIAAIRSTPGQAVEEGEVIGRIPVPADVPVQACDPAVETEPAP